MTRHRGVGSQRGEMVWDESLVLSVVLSRTPEPFWAWPMEACSCLGLGVPVARDAVMHEIL